MFAPLKIDRETEDNAQQTCFFQDGYYEGRKLRVSKLNYLALLSMRGEDIPAEIDKLRSLANEVDREVFETDLIKLLAAVNWRYHNIACVFISIGISSDGILTALWKRISEGSWVSPQLVATAALSDPTFTSKASELISNDGTYYKSIVALAEILERTYKTPIGCEISLLNINTAKNYDRDNSGAIAIGWMESFQKATT